MTAISRITTPWTREQVAALQAYQDAGYMHPFTCPTDDHSSIGNLIPTTRGWICQFCDYTQDWAHSFMFDAPRNPFAEHVMQRRVERVAQSLARSEMFQALEQSGVSAMSPEAADKLFRSAWEGTTEHDERCRRRCRDTAMYIISALDRTDA